MTKYLLLYRNPVSMFDRQPSPDEMQQMLAQWGSWKEKFGDSIVDLGDGLKGTGRQLKGGEVSDGPYVEAKEVLGGFSIVQAASYEGAVEIAKECPVKLMPGNTIEIREMMGF